MNHLRFSFSILIKIPQIIDLTGFIKYPVTNECETRSPVWRDDEVTFISRIIVVMGK